MQSFDPQTVQLSVTRSVFWAILALASCGDNKVCQQESGACLAVHIDGLATDASLSIHLADFFAQPLANYNTESVHSPITVEVPASRVDGPLTVQSVRCLWVGAIGQNLSARTRLTWPADMHVTRSVELKPPAVPTFQVSDVFPIGTTGVNSDSQTIAVANLDIDDHLDLVVANTDPSQKSISVLHGNGDGSWSNVQVIPSMTLSPRGLTIADLNKDGLLDIAAGVTDPMAQPILTSLQQSNGQFGALTPLVGTDGGQPISIAVADLDQDGLNDLAVAYSGDTVLRLFKNTTPWGQSPVQVASKNSLSVGPQAVQVSALDLDGDKRPDLVVTLLTGAPNIGIALNAGSFTFNLSTLGLPVRPALFATADIDGDHRNDLLVTNNSDSGNMGMSQVSVFLGKQRPWQTAFSSADAMTSFARAVVVGDFDGDQIPDLAVIGYESSKLAILKGDGTGNFVLLNTQIDVGCANPLSLVGGDFNEDCKPDLAVACDGGKSVHLLLNTTPT